ncbi:hypothetical protein FB451DRAFT_762737 [Mycena latifolia]|nr:hypothetical protein FB451DRAFT_762737 [Mycena latifolia]
MSRTHVPRSPISLLPYSEARQSFFLSSFCPSLSRSSRSPMCPPASAAVPPLPSFLVLPTLLPPLSSHVFDCRRPRPRISLQALPPLSARPFASSFPLLPCPRLPPRPRAYSSPSSSIPSSPRVLPIPTFLLRSRRVPRHTSQCLILSFSSPVPAIAVHIAIALSHFFLSRTLPLQPRLRPLALQGPAEERRTVERRRPTARPPPPPALQAPLARKHAHLAPRHLTSRYHHPHRSSATSAPAPSHPHCGTDPGTPHTDPNAPTHPPRDARAAGARAARRGCRAGGCGRTDAAEHAYARLPALAVLAAAGDDAPDLRGGAHGPAAREGLADGGGCAGGGGRRRVCRHEGRGRGWACGRRGCRGRGGAGGQREGGEEADAQAHVAAALADSAGVARAGEGTGALQGGEGREGREGEGEAASDDCLAGAGGVRCAGEGERGAGGERERGGQGERGDGGGDWAPGTAGRGRPCGAAGVVARGGERGGRGPHARESRAGVGVRGAVSRAGARACGGRGAEGGGRHLAGVVQRLAAKLGRCGRGEHDARAGAHSGARPAPDTPCACDECQSCAPPDDARAPPGDTAVEARVQAVRGVAEAPRGRCRCRYRCRRGRRGRSLVRTHPQRQLAHIDALARDTLAHLKHRTRGAPPSQATSKAV